MQECERHSQLAEVEELKKRRRFAAERVRHALQELEDAERDFAALTDELNRALDGSSRDAA